MSGTGYALDLSPPGSTIDFSLGPLTMADASLLTGIGNAVDAAALIDSSAVLVPTDPSYGSVQAQAAASDVFAQPATDIATTAYDPSALDQSAPAPTSGLSLTTMLLIGGGIALAVLLLSRE